ncbi:MAG: PUA domain-containing protein [Candidatus Woesearchaeota archaeon]
MKTIESFINVTRHTVSMRTRTLAKSEIRELNMELFQEYGIEPLSKKDLILMVEDEPAIIKIKGEPSFFYEDNIITPTLKFLLKDCFLKKVTVDMGAVKFVASGADVMRPGIVEVSDGIIKDELVAIIDEKNKKPLAIGYAQGTSEEIKEQKSGKSVKTIHYVGDSIWSYGEK